MKGFNWLVGNTSPRIRRQFSLDSINLLQFFKFHQIFLHFPIHSPDPRGGDIASKKLRVGKNGM